MLQLKLLVLCYVGFKKTDYGENVFESQGNLFSISKFKFIPFPISFSLTRKFKYTFYWENGGDHKNFQSYLHPNYLIYKFQLSYLSKSTKCLNHPFPFQPKSSKPSVVGISKNFSFRKRREKRMATLNIMVIIISVQN